MASAEPNPGPLDVHIFRYEYLLIEVGTQMLRKLFDTLVGEDFGEYLKIHPHQSKKLRHLMKYHVIPGSYLENLPPHNDTPNTANFDIFLLTILLRNVCGLRDAYEPVWRHPALGDKSPEANIAMLSRCRNEFMRRSGVFISEPELNAKREELVLILERLNLFVGNQELPSLIENAEQLILDKELQTKWNENMETWSWNESQIVNVIDDFKDGLDELKATQDNMYQMLKRISQDETELKKDVSEKTHGASKAKYKKHTRKTDTARYQMLKRISQDETELKKDVSEKTHGASKAKYKKHTRKTDTARYDKQVQLIYKRVDNGNKTAQNNTPWVKVVADLTNYESIADDLLTKDVLPDKSDLDLIIRQVGRKKPLANRICTAICAYLQNKYESVLKAFAAFSDKKDSVQNMENIDKDCVVFVLLKKDDMKINCEEYRTYETQVGRISPDRMKINRNTSDFEQNHTFCQEQLEKLESCVQQHSNALFQKHSNLTMVSASWCKSHGLGNLLFSPCVALYVPIKGLIPLAEDPFDSTIGEYLVDVREGVFELFGDPNDYHEHLQMGCTITGGLKNQDEYSCGTLGTFFTLNDDANEVFAITSAHVVLNDDGMNELLNKEDVNYININAEVYHPICEPLVSFGRLVFATYSPGQNGESGMEIAIIQMNSERLPENGSFPDANDHSEKGFDHRYPYKFSSGMCCDIDSLHLSPVVLKYGSVSKLTQGKVRMRGTAVRTGTLSKKVLQSQLELHNQIEIESLGSEPFAKNGDSGSLVLAKAKEGLVAVGILEGQINNVFIVTPMINILKTLKKKVGVCRLLSFDKNNCTATSDDEQPRRGKDESIGETGALLSDRVSNIERRMQRFEKKTEDSLQSVSNDLKTVLGLLQSNQGMSPQQGASGSNVAADNILAGSSKSQV